VKSKEAVLSMILSMFISMLLRSYRAAIAQCVERCFQISRYKISFHVNLSASFCTTFHTILGTSVPPKYCGVMRTGFITEFASSTQLALRHSKASQLQCNRLTSEFILKEDIGGDLPRRLLWVRRIPCPRRALARHRAGSHTMCSACCPP
jgi:hypothetical protein